MKSLFLLAVITILPLTASAKWDHTCGQGVAQARPYRWCIDEPEGSQRRHLIYYFHGYSGSEQSWSQGEDAKDLEKISNESDVGVVSISFGDAWLLTGVSHDGPMSELLPLMTQSVLPGVERELGVINPVRDIRGDSMGGFNVTALVFDRPDLFRRVAIVCPMLSGLSPRASADDIDRFVQASGAKRGWVAELLDWLKWEFPDDQVWETADPLHKPIPAGLSRLKIHTSCGETDEYGYHHTTQALYERLKFTGSDVEFESLKGGHCVSDGARLARFFSDP